MAEERKEFGNTCFQKGKLDAAIEAYSEAICLDPQQAVFRTNRAMCYLKKEAWEKVASDCKAALALEPNSIKGHYLLGNALVEQASYEEGVHHLQQALHLCKERTVSYKDDIMRSMLKGRKRRWASGHAAAIARQERSETLAGLALRAHFQAEARHLGRTGDPTGVSASQQEGQDVLSLALEEKRRRLTPAAPPDRFCCKISMEVRHAGLVGPAHQPAATPFGQPAATPFGQPAGTYHRPAAPPSAPGDDRSGDHTERDHI